MDAKQNKVSHCDNRTAFNVSWYAKYVCVCVSSYRAINFFYLARLPASVKVSKQGPNNALNAELSGPHLCLFVSKREGVKTGRKKKSMCFCVYSGNGGLTAPSVRALAVPGSHGQSRGAIMDSQDGSVSESPAWRYALPTSDTEEWRLSLAAGEFQA